MSSNGTIQLKDNQSPTAADAEMGRIFWDNTEVKFKQIDETGAISDFGADTSAVWGQITGTLSNQ